MTKKKKYFFGRLTTIRLTDDAEAAKHTTTNEEDPGKGPSVTDAASRHSLPSGVVRQREYGGQAWIIKAAVYDGDWSGDQNFD